MFTVVDQYIVYTIRYFNVRNLFIYGFFYKFLILHVFFQVLYFRLWMNRMLFVNDQNVI